MKIYSFVRKALELVPVEVEINLLGGVNQLQIVGLPDKAIRESGLKIKSALKTQGYKWPAGQQILINLRPPHWKKTSRGLELAIACAYLWRSGQLRLPNCWGDKIFVYGELGLDGSVYAPSDLDSLFDHSLESPILTGFHHESLPWNFLMVKDLRSLVHPEKMNANFISNETPFTAPPILDLEMSQRAARLLKIIALGEHATLIAGPAGSGKTTLAHALHCLLGPPSPTLWPQMARIKRWFNDSSTLRPFVSPHHSVSPSSMIGGGFPIFPGEITRAHGGVLFLDEFLEFPEQVKESLREPLESGEIVISRRGQSQSFPARFLLIATTNLCHCGRLVPGRKEPCRFSLAKCRSYLERMSGPMLDRFDILAFSTDWARTESPMIQVPQTSKNSVAFSNGSYHRETLNSVFQAVEKGREFQRQRHVETSNHSLQNIEVNGRMDGEKIAKTLPEFVREHLIPETGTSHRRRRALMRVARTIADLEESDLIQISHLREASEWAWQNFEDLHQIFA